MNKIEVGQVFSVANVVSGIPKYQIGDVGIFEGKEITILDYFVDYKGSVVYEYMGTDGYYAYVYQGIDIN